MKKVLRNSLSAALLMFLMQWALTGNAQTAQEQKQKFLPLPGFTETGNYETDLVTYNAIYQQMAVNNTEELRAIEKQASGYGLKKKITSDRLATMPAETQEMIRSNPDKYEIIETNGSYGTIDSEPVPTYGPKEITKAQLSTMPEVTQQWIKQHPDQYKIVD